MRQLSEDESMCYSYAALMSYIALSKHELLDLTVSDFKMKTINEEESKNR